MSDSFTKKTVAAPQTLVKIVSNWFVDQTACPGPGPSPSPPALLTSLAIMIPTPMYYGFGSQ